MNKESVFYLLGGLFFATYLYASYRHIKKHEEILYSYSPKGIKKMEFSILREVFVRSIIIGISVPQVCNASVYGLWGDWVIPPASIGTRSIVLFGAAFYSFYVWENSINYVIGEIDKRKKTE